MGVAFFTIHKIWYGQKKREKNWIFSLTSLESLYYNSFCAIARKGLLRPYDRNCGRSPSLWRGHRLVEFAPPALLPRPGRPICDLEV